MSELKPGDRILISKADLWKGVLASGWLTYMEPEDWKQSIAFDNSDCEVRLFPAVRSVFHRAVGVALTDLCNMDCMIEQAICEGLIDVPDGWSVG